MRDLSSRTVLFFTIACVLTSYASGVVFVLLGHGLFGISKMLFLRFDLIAASVSAVITLFVAFLTPRVDRRQLTGLLEWSKSSWVIPVVALTSFLIAIIGTRIVYLEFALSMDEWMPRLQAIIFREGLVTANVEEEWRPWGHLIYHYFAVFDPNTGQLASNYRPGLAVIIAIFDGIGLGPYISSFFHLGSILLVAAVTRQIAPEQPFAPIFSALLLATSMQAIAAAFTTYAMSGHLFFNLLWLHLFLRQKNYWHACAACIGVVAASLHQVHMHVFFALPFLFLLLRPLNLQAIGIYSVIYVIGHASVISWDKVLFDPVTNDSVNAAQSTFDTLLTLFTLPSFFELATVWANVIRLFLWQNLAFLPLLLVYAMASIGRDKYQYLLIASVVSSLLPYLFLMPDQGHGWGYRYLHGLLGNLTILAAIAGSWLVAMRPKSILLSFNILLFIASCFVMIALRFVQIASFVEPYARASAFAHAQDSEVVMVDDYSTAIGSDIPRNHPTNLKRPVVMYLSRAVASDLAALCNKTKPNVLTGEDFAPLGVTRVTHNNLVHSEDRFFLFEVLNHRNCGQTVKKTESRTE